MDFENKFSFFSNLTFDHAYYIVEFLIITIIS